MLRAPNLLALLLACACLPATADATQSARIHVAFTPEHLGQGTTINLNAQISTPSGLVPSPLTVLDVRYPRDLGVATGGLGVASCSPARLEALGPEECPADSHMGQGSALAEVPIGPIILQETAEVAIIRGPQQEGHLALLFYVNAGGPVSAQIVLTGMLLPGPGADDETIQIDVPLVPSVTGSPNVAVVQLHVTLGPRGLTYYEYAHGTLIAYHPDGVLLPHHCPRGGFPFGASLTFEDGSNASASTTVPCPTLEGPSIGRDHRSKRRTHDRRVRRSADVGRSADVVDRTQPLRCSNLDLVCRVPATSLLADFAFLLQPR